MLRHSCRINSKAAFFILKAAAVHIADDGKIITIVTALLGAYAGSKAPVEHFTRGVCKALMERHVSVNNLAPGPMDTRKLTYPKSSLLQLTPV
jgi:NAD(P)-dependent dehydrogenase (short-subunit alcohol dehydrogenase family)